MSDAMAVVLAAGQGTRMKSDLPKVLIEVHGRPMIHWVLDAVFAAGVGHVVAVVGYRSDDVRSELSGRKNIEFAEQTEQLGTGHAVMMCMDHIRSHDGPVLVLTGDSPLVQRDSLKQLLAIFQQRQPACLLGTLHKENPVGLGRILRDQQGQFAGIVEEKDATPQQRQITEVNMSTYVFNSRDLLDALPKLSRNNQQKELYITDCPAILRAAGRPILAEPVLAACEALSINNFDELKLVEGEMRRLGY